MEVVTIFTCGKADRSSRGQFILFFSDTSKEQCDLHDSYDSLMNLALAQTHQYGNWHLTGEAGPAAGKVRLRVLRQRRVVVLLRLLLLARVPRPRVVGIGGARRRAIQRRRVAAAEGGQRQQEGHDGDGREYFHVRGSWRLRD